MHFLKLSTYMYIVYITKKKTHTFSELFNLFLNLSMKLAWGDNIKIWLCDFKEL